MRKVKSALFILVILLLYSCQRNKINKNNLQDKNKVDSIINNFYTYEKNRDYNAMFKLFTLGNSKLSKEEINSQLTKIFIETLEKSGDIKRIISKTYNTEVRTNKKDTVGLYEATIDNERSFLLTRETFKLMLENNRIKIYDYHIAVKAK